MLPTLFLSHGAPTLPLDDVPAPLPARPRGHAGPAERHPRRLRPLGDRRAGGQAVARNATIHDFYGFPPALYELAYPAPGDPALAARVAGLLEKAGFQAGRTARAARSRRLGAAAADVAGGRHPGAAAFRAEPLGPAHHLRLGARWRRCGSRGCWSSARAASPTICAASAARRRTRRRAGRDRRSPTGCTRRWPRRRREDLLDYRRRAPYAA